MSASLEEKRRVYRAYLEDEVPGGMPKHILYEKGQPDDFASPLILVDEDEDQPDGVIAVVRDDMNDHWNAGLNGVRTTIEEGHCERCGSNRVRVSVLEPAGEVMVNCAVCKISDDNADVYVEGGA